MSLLVFKEGLGSVFGRGERVKRSKVECRFDPCKLRIECELFRASGYGLRTKRFLDGPEGTSLDASWCSYLVCGSRLARVSVMGLDLMDLVELLIVITIVFVHNPKGLTTGHIYYKQLFMNQVL